MRVASGGGARTAGPCTLSLGLSLAAAGPAGGQAADTFYGSLVKGDQVHASTILQDAVELYGSQQAAAWRNDVTGTSGSTTPVRTFRIKTGHFCREFRETVITEGHLSYREGVACRQDDGIWVLVEQ